MTPWAELQRELDALLALDEAVRRQYLVDLQSQNPTRAAELSRLLEAAEGTQWEQQMAGGAADDVVQALGERLQRATELTGTQIGPYHLVRLLGQGGMGAVYLAERADGAYQQQTALKIVPGRTLDSSAGERFVNERQILARLTHPNIARLLDGGLTDSGSPYLVMEFVDGPDLLAFAEQQPLALAPRLNLYNQLLDAVEFAHRNLIVHGDLKPDNILIDSQGQLKLLDFGIAQALDNASGDDNPALTPAYASPERLAGARLNTANDIYALGVLLYRLIGGRPPYDLANMPVAQMADKVRQAKVPRLRQTSQLTGVGAELESICATALAVDPAQRYPTVVALRQDLAALSANQPVAAHPASRRYRAQKFARRHRLGLAAATLVAIAIGTGTTAALVQADKAQAQAARAEQVSNFLANLFDAANPFGAWKEEKSVVDLLEFADSQAVAQLGDNPVVLAKVQAMLGEAYLGNGNYQRAASISRQVLATSQANFGHKSLEAAQAHNQLAHALIEQGEYEEAAQHAQQAVDTFQQQGASQHIQLANSLTNFAVAISSQGQRAEAKTLHQRALAIREQSLPATHTSIADSKMSLASVNAALGELTDVVALNRAAYDIYQAQFGAEHPMTMRAMNGIASGEFLSGNYQGAAAAFQLLLTQSSQRLGPEHPELALLHNNLGRALTELGHFADAAHAYQAAADRISNAPSQRLLSISVRFNQATLAAELGNFDTAIPQLVQAGDDFGKVLGSNHPLSYRAAVQLAGSRALAAETTAEAELKALIHNNPGATSQPQWQARAQLALARLLLLANNTVDAATQLSAAQDRLLANTENTSWRYHDFHLLQAVATGDVAAQRQHGRALADRLPANSVRRQFAERYLQNLIEGGSIEQNSTTKVRHLRG